MGCTTSEGGFVHVELIYLLNEIGDASIACLSSTVLCGYWYRVGV